MTAATRVVRSCPRYFGLARNAIASGPPSSSVPTRRTIVAPSASSRAPVRSASTASGKPEAGSAGSIVIPGRSRRNECCGLLVGQRLDHLFGDVDALAREHDRVLQDEIELLGLGDLLDDLVRALLDARELLVLAQVQVLAKLALHALQIARKIREVALLAAALGLGHRRAILVERCLQVSNLPRELSELRVALRE